MTISFASLVNVWAAAVLALLSGQLISCCCAFSPPITTKFAQSTQRIQIARKQQQRYGKLFSSNNNGQYDLSKPTFDIYTLRGVRGDALAKYNSLNQSEPLRINLSLLAALLCACYPFLASQETSGVQDLLGGDSSPTTTALCAVASVALAWNFRRECGRRNRQLMRLEKELQSRSLSLRLPSRAARLSCDSSSLYESTAQTLGQAQKERTLRVLALYGTGSQLTESLQSLAVLGQRLVQSETIVVPVPADGSTRIDWGLDGKTGVKGGGGWLASPVRVSEWRDYFTDALATSTDGGDGEDVKFKWFGLSAIGRSFGSGQGDIPSWIELLGQHLRPTVILDSEDPNEDDSAGVLDVLAEFYKALSQGDLGAMERIFLSENASKVSSIIEQGGRLDSWEECLKDGNRPEGMAVANADVFVVNGTQAYSTVIEFPATGMVPSDTTAAPTLLAMQSWKKSGSTSDGGEESSSEWKLAQHQTIPWSDAVPAAGTLLGDWRGCVSLVRSNGNR